MAALTALVIALLIAILYWLATALPMKSAARQALAGICIVIVLVLLLAVIGLVHLGVR